MGEPKPHRRRRQLLIGVLALLVVLVAAGGFYAWTLNNKLDNIERIPIGKIKDRPDPDSGKDLNILLLGSDKGDTDDPAFTDTSLAEDARGDTWPVGKYRSDTLMVVHISGDRKQVAVASIPRDTLVTLYDDTGAATHKAKINAAFSEYGPAGAIATVEHLTNLRMDHVAIIDWAGFKDLSTAVGGVPVHIPQSFYDPKQKVQWNAGDYVLEGKEALQYVRTRHGLLRGDFDRIERQQNFMRSLMNEVLDAGDLTKPLEFNDMLEALTRNLTVDDGWENSEIRSLALSLRGTHADKVTFLTVPVSGTPTVAVYGSIVELDLASSRQLFTAMRDDKVRSYVKAHEDLVLPDADEID
jgi:LCP family protein required for cell wall assembly